MKQPNVLIFFTDQQRWDTLGIHGNPTGLTPNLDAYAQRGTFCAEAVTCQPVCGPARSCLQTGQYASQTGVWQNSLPLRDDAITLAQCFRDAGYATSYIGKWHLGGPECPPGPVPPARRGGYERWLAAETLELVSGPYSTTLWNEQDKAIRLPGYRVDAMTDEAIRQLNHAAQNDERPQFLCLSFLEPHHQNTNDSYPAPHFTETLFRGSWMPPDLQTLGGSSHAQWTGYCGMVKRLDEAFGRLMEAVHSFDSTRETIVCYLSDHGCHFKTRNDDYKRTCHESSVRIPLVFSGGPFEGGGRLDQATSLVDVPATLLDAADIKVPSTMSGRSILPLTRKTSGDWPDEAFIQFGDKNVRTGRALRSKRWKYAISIPDGAETSASAEVYVESHLYDLNADPYELTNLIGFPAYKEIRSRFRERILKRMQSIGELICTITVAEGSKYPLPNNHSQRTVEYPDSCRNHLHS
ncbi:sulfatase-like hydrolase/transferase [Puniceicoccus vermicola]|uniref:Sulfatase-like hydrolase/transferase n=1 Tax=Puniceicoccus vermicola TaxID=388746 RepID=A0A7X1B094_9BACT|nr:sulfatase-like hydrolase/transferase [Puniceicoccus vermicola]MBC2603248.1 sulfatase-like hydrolase/transferase [Puniceicoccus vermicola]